MSDYTVTMKQEEIYGIIDMEKDTLGISVIMPSYLGNYSNGRSNSIDKFIRAVDSFLNQPIKQKELIIISDGCEKTNRIYFDMWQNNEDIKLIRCERYEERWPGNLREMGRCIAKYEWITYLDSDDIFLSFHLSNLAEAIRFSKTPVLLQKKAYMPYVKNPNDVYLNFVYINRDEYLQLPKHTVYSIIDDIETICVEFGGYNGTWQISHKNDIRERWKSSESIGEDADFIKRILNTNNAELFNGGYLICHMEEKSKVIVDF